MNGSSCCAFDLVPVDGLELDLTNPRIAKYVEMYGSKISAEQMSLALGAGDSQTEEGSTTFYSLKESIKTNGGVIHPIIVSKHDDGRLVVIEGNTRTLIYREFCEQAIPGDWAKIPAMVYRGLSLADIDAIRLQTHLVGPRPWDPYSKAKYLDHLKERTTSDFRTGRGFLRRQETGGPGLHRRLSRHGEALSPLVGER